MNLPANREPAHPPVVRTAAQPGRGQAPATAGFGGRDVLRIIRKRKLLIMLTLLVSITVVGVGTLLWWIYAPLYTAKAYLEVRPPQPSAMAPMAETYAKDVTDRMTNQQARLVKREIVLQRAAEHDRLRSTGWYHKSPETAVKRLMEDIEATPVPNSLFVELSMTGLNKDELPEIVNAVAEAAVSENRDTSSQSKRDEIAKLENEKKESQDKLTRIHAQQAAASTSADIPNLQERLSVLTLKLQELTRNLTLLEMAKAQAEAQLETVKRQEASGQLERAPEVSIVLDNDPTLRTLKLTLEQYTTERDSLLKKFMPSHRAVQSVEVRMESLNGRIEENKRTLLKQQIDFLREQREGQVSAVTAQLLEVRQKYNESTAQARDLQQTLALLSQLTNSEKGIQENIQNLDKRLMDLRLLYDTPPLMLRGFATRPFDPSMPKWSIMMPLGVVLGLMLGFGLAFMLELMDTSIKSAADVSRRVDLPVLGMVPHSDDVEEDIADIRLAFQTSPTSLLTEAFRQIRTCLQFSGPADQRKVLLVTSPMPEDGRTTVTLNLGAAVAHGGRKTLIIDANFRQPVIHRLFPASHNGGLSSALVGQAKWQDLVTPVSDNLHVLAAGPLPPNPSDLLGSDAMRQALAEMGQAYDQVLIDGAPCLVVTDAAVLSTLVDGVILVVRAHANTYGIVQRTRDILNRIGAHIIGVALNGVRITSGGYLKKTYETFYEYHEQMDQGGEQAKLPAKA